MGIFMRDNSIYGDISKRTGGDIYLGVVGPVRTGKSTFIRRFLDSVVLPNIENEYDRERTQDQIPQSAGGRTVMTTEPKFIPDESVRIKLGDDTECNVKLIDCVGYMVDGAMGDTEEGVPRLITTPWSDEPMPFSEAAELGTGKVIGEHSTIGVLVTTDGTIGELPREAYIAAEERVAEELNALGKPYAIVLNSKFPSSEEAKALAMELEEKYHAPVALVSCPDIDKDDVREILALVLGEFPVRELTFRLPEWCCALPSEHPLRAEIMGRIEGFADGVSKLGDISRRLKEEDGISIVSIDAGSGTGEMEIPLSDEIYYKTLSEMTGIDLGDKRKLFSALIELSGIKAQYDTVASALREVEDKGYGIVMPTVEGMTLEEPRLVKQAGGYGVRVTAHADTLHLIRTEIRAEVCPVVGTKEQSEEMVRYLTEEYENDPDGIWESNMFGRSLYELVCDGMSGKLKAISDDSREKLGETLERIINEGAGGLLCILL